MTTEFTPSHTVPSGGLPVWTDPDGRVDPVARLDPDLTVELAGTSGDWAHIRCSNDWMGWVDARRLVPLAAQPPQPPPRRDAVVADTPTATAQTTATPATPAATTPVESVPAGGSVGSYADVYRRAKPAGTSPARIAATAAAEAPPGRPSVSLLLAGALLVGIGGFLPWLSFPNTPSSGAPSIPLQFLVDIRTTADGPVDLIVPLLAAAVIGAVATVMPSWARARRIAGWSVVVLTSVFVGQLQRLLSDFGPGSPSLTETVGVGVVATLAGGLILGLAPDKSKETPSS